MLYIWVNCAQSFQFSNRLTEFAFNYECIANQLNSQPHIMNSKISKDLNFEWNYTQLKFKPETAEKNESTIGPPAGIEPPFFAML